MPALLLLLALATARADDAPPLAIPAPPPSEPPLAVPARPPSPPKMSARALRGQDLERAAGPVIGAGVVVIMVGGIGGLASAATVGPCDGNGVCGQESAFGRIGVPIIVGVGGGMALSGILMKTLGARMAPRRPGMALVVPAWVDDGPAIAVVGRF